MTKNYFESEEEKCGLQDATDVLRFQAEAVAAAAAAAAESDVNELRYTCEHEIICAGQLYSLYKALQKNEL
jgi:hypothetical protein